MEKRLIWEKEDGIGIVRLNRPEKMNAINRRDFKDLSETLESAEKDGDVKVVILTGTGTKAFCAGADIKEHPAFFEDNPLTRDKFIKEGQHITLLLNRLPKPVIAAVNGTAAGAGLELAMACDMRIASEDATFAEIFARAGLMPDMGGTYFLPRLVGLGKALELLFTGDTIDAHEAYRIGLCNQVVPPSELMPQAKALGRRLAKGPTDSYRLVKWAVYRGLSQDLEGDLEREKYGMNLLLGTEFVREFAKTFANKTK